MIVGALLIAVVGLVDLIASVLPTGGLALGSWGNLADEFGTYAGPANSWLPMRELAQALIIYFGVWMPAVLIYSAVRWAYQHIPFLGS